MRDDTSYYIKLFGASKEFQVYLYRLWRRRQILHSCMIATKLKNKVNSYELYI